jgi:hypothetical protein
LLVIGHLAVDGHFLLLADYVQIEGFQPGSASSAFLTLLASCSSLTGIFGMCQQRRHR